MRIITLKAENVKRLKAVEIQPDGDVVVIAGRNAQGKSSVLDAIWLALAGAAGAKETTRPIRDAEITLADDERIVSVESIGPLGKKLVWIANDRNRLYQTVKFATDNALLDYDFGGIFGY